MPNIQVDANLFRLAYLCTSKEQTRYYLNGVFIEPHHTRGVTLTATDGHRLVHIWDENGTCDKPAIIQVDKAVLAACKPNRKTIAGNEKRIEITHPNNSETTLTVDGKRYSYALVDGAFPDYRNVIPTNITHTNKPVTFDFEYFATWATIAKELGSGKSHVTLVTNDPGSPALVSLGVDHAFGVQMPCRGCSILHSPPAWFNKPETKLSVVA